MLRITCWLTVADSGRLLFHRVRPVFVFDGATPALKRHTAIARRRRREVQQGVVRRTAEKLLVAQLKKQVGRRQVAVGEQWSLQHLPRREPFTF